MTRGLRPTRVIPAYAGISASPSVSIRPETPACAGVTR